MDRKELSVPRNTTDRNMSRYGRKGRHIRLNISPENFESDKTLASNHSLATKRSQISEMLESASEEETKEEKLSF
jgi:hypothetical protein